MSRFDFIIKYRKGLENSRVDVLSRKQEYIRNILKTYRIVLKETHDGLVLNRKTVATIIRIKIDNSIESEIKGAYETDSTAR